MNDVLIVIGGIIAVVIVWRLLKNIISFIVSVAIVAVVIYFIYSSSSLIGGNALAKLETLKTKYCNDQTTEVKCRCVAEPILDDLDDRFSADEYAALKNDKLSALQAVKNSYEALKPEIEACTADENAPDAAAEVMTDLVGGDIFSRFRNLKDDIEQRSEKYRKIEDKY